MTVEFREGRYVVGHWFAAAEKDSSNFLAVLWRDPGGALTLQYRFVWAKEPDEVRRHLVQFSDNTEVASVCRWVRGTADDFAREVGGAEIHYHPLRSDKLEWIVGLLSCEEYWHELEETS